MENAIPELFVGHYSNYVECLNVPYTSSRKQPYMEIQLDVLGCKNIYESLERFCAEERMEGPNKYNAEKHGLQVRSHSLHRRHVLVKCVRSMSPVRMPNATHGSRASLLFCSCI